MQDPKAFLKDLFDIAIQAADADFVLDDYLPQDRTGKVTVIGAGKGAAKMAQAFEKHWEGEIKGLVITRYGHAVPTQHIEVIEASHPVPDEAGLEGAKRILELVEPLGADDQVIALISGGGSALLALPKGGVTMAQKQQVNKDLLASGATIDEINCVRKHLSAIKGGRLAKACAPAKLLTLSISDVPGDNPSVIASGPTVGDETTCAQAQEILQRYGLKAPAKLEETVKPDDPLLENCAYELIATPQKSLQAAADHCEKQGLKALILSDRIEGEAREVAKVHAAIVRQIQDHGQPIQPPCVILSGGEATVTIQNKDGRGGPNQEFMLSFLEQIQGLDNVFALSADTDGIDGSEDNAGAWVDPTSFKRANAAGLNIYEYLNQNKSYDFFITLEDSFKPGPTLTNVNDFRAIYVGPRK